MSYARWSDRSDLYVYLDVRGFLNCCCGPMSDRTPIGFDFRTETTAEMIAHIEEHIRNGDLVPDTLVPKLQADAATIDAEIAKWLALPPEAREL
jgi:hypothetical protein